VRGRQGRGKRMERGQEKREGGGREWREGKRSGREGEGMERG